MTDQLTLALREREFTRGFRVEGEVRGVFRTASTEDFQTVPCDDLELTFAGLPGDRHAGFTRRSGGREPWYPRGTEMCNERQVSILSVEDLSRIAARMELDDMKAEWIGGNILLSGIPDLSMVPPRTRLVFGNGAVIRIDGYNSPCRFSGRAVADKFPDRDGLDLLFAERAVYLRGLVGFVERPGTVVSGESATAHIPEQWIYSRG